MSPVHIRVAYPMFTLFVVDFDKDVPIFGCKDRAMDFSHYTPAVLQQTITLVQDGDTDVSVEAFSVLQAAA